MSCHLYHWGRQSLLCAAACCAMAIDAPQIGAQALASWPTGEMREQFTSRNGYGLGVFAGWEVGAGRALRIAYDGIWYRSHDHAKPRSHCLSAQYLVYPSGEAEGVYFKAGLGAMNYLTRDDNPATNPPGDNRVVLVETGTKLATLAGVGYDFNKNWGVLAQYSFITSSNHTQGSVQTGISYRF